MPTIRTLQDIMDDDNFAKYAEFSEYNLLSSVHVSATETPIYTFAPPQPPPEPPPSRINVVTVPEHEWRNDEQHLPGISWVAPDITDPTMHSSTHHDYLAWDTFMFPTSELESRTMTTANILRLLQQHDKEVYSQPLSPKQAFIKLQCDGGANRSVTNDESLLHVSWDISPYSIGGIGTGITCTKKGLFHLICDDESILPVEMFYSAEATETVISPTDIVFSNSDKYDSWWQLNNCAKGNGGLRFYHTNELFQCNVRLSMHNKLWFIEQDIITTRNRNRINTFSDDFVHSVSGTTLHNLWHHRLFHAGNFVCSNIDDVVDGVLNLRHKNLSSHAPTVRLEK